MRDIAEGRELGGSPSIPAEKAPGRIGSGADGMWTVIQPTGVAGHSAIFDSLRNRMVVFGGTFLGNETWELSLTGTPKWTLLSPLGPLPPPRRAHSAIHDAPRNRMIIFGGSDGESALGDVWSLTLGAAPTWSQLTPAGVPPSPRWGHTAIHDVSRDRMIMFGGRALEPTNETWMLTLSDEPTWTLLAVTGSEPTARYRHSAILDPVRDRMIVFGGTDVHAVRLQDVWSLPLGTSGAWTDLTPAAIGPAARDGHAAAYDPVQDRMLVFGGEGESLGRLNDLWTLSLDGKVNWTPVSPIGIPPTPRTSHEWVYDSSRQTLIVYGGYGGSELNDIWELSLADPEWISIPPGLSPPRSDFSAIHDPLRDRMVVFVGPSADVWSLFFSPVPRWVQMEPSGTPPLGRTGQSIVYDTPRDRILLFGGQNWNDVWALSLSAEPPFWSEVVPAGAPPAPRQGHSAIYDPVRDRMVIFGGGDYNTYRRDVWSLSLSDPLEWTQLSPTGIKPFARDNHTAIYDAARDRMLVFAGRNASIVFNDTWQLALGGVTSWTQVLASGSAPNATYGHSAVYDPARDQMVVLRGEGFPDPSDDVFALDLAAAEWRALDTTGPSPSERYGSVAIYDSLRDRMVLFGGTGWTDLRILELGEPTPVLPVTSLPSRPLSSLPNPFRSEVTLRFSISAPSPVRAEVFDVAGRRRRVLIERSMSSGEHSVTWDGTDDTGTQVSSGTYFLRLSTEGRTEVRKCVRFTANSVP